MEQSDITNSSNSRSASKKGASLAAKASERGKSEGRKARKYRNDAFRMRRELREAWTRWYRKRKKRLKAEAVYRKAEKRFVRGFVRKAEMAKGKYVPIPSARKAAAVLTHTRHSPFKDALLELERLLLDDVVVVTAGLEERELDQLLKHSARPVVIHYPADVGADVGRAIGAKATDAELLLFVEGSSPAKAEKLLPFLQAVARGGDVALNDLKPLLPPFGSRSPQMVVQEFVNLGLGRRDLGASSLAIVPHAMSRRAAEKIGYAALTVPTVAHSRALQLRLSVSTPASVPFSDKRIGGRSASTASLTDLAKGDSFEAIAEIIDSKGNRLGYEDNMRKRSHLGG